MDRDEARDDPLAAVDDEGGSAEQGSVDGDQREDDGPGLTDEARSRGGKNSSQEQKRDEQGRFVGKD